MNHLTIKVEFNDNDDKIYENDFSAIFIVKLENIQIAQIIIYNIATFRDWEYQNFIDGKTIDLTFTIGSHRIVKIERYENENGSYIGFEVSKLTDLLIEDGGGSIDMLFPEKLVIPGIEKIIAKLKENN